MLQSKLGEKAFSARELEAMMSLTKKEIKNLTKTGMLIMEPVLGINKYRVNND